MAWHKEELTLLYNKIPANMKDRVWDAYVEAAKEIGPLPGELSLMSKIFKKPKPKGIRAASFKGGWI